MYFPNAKTKGIQKEFAELERIMKGLGFVRWSWDYEKVYYDYKYTTDGADYYLRLRADVVGDKYLEHPKALCQVDIPVFVRHFFPHGLDDEAEVPESIQEEVQAKIQEVEKALSE